MKKQTTWIAIISLSLGALVAGCGGGDETASTTAPTTTANGPSIVPEGGAAGSSAGTMKEIAEILKSAEAGITLPGPMTVNIIEAAQKEAGGRMRYDAFALLPVEKGFDRKQEAARLVADSGGGFSLIYQAPPEPVDEEMTVEPQPYRRLSGVLLGEGVIAIIEMEDGKTYMIRPGMQVGNTEWTCISIDTDKAILRRKSERRPKEIYIRLESRPAGAGRGGGGGNAGGGNALPEAGNGQSGAGQAGERSPNN